MFPQRRGVVVGSDNTPRRLEQRGVIDSTFFRHALIDSWNMAVCDGAHYEILGSDLDGRHVVNDANEIQILTVKVSGERMLICFTNILLLDRQGQLRLVRQSAYAQATKLVPGVEGCDLTGF